MKPKIVVGELVIRSPLAPSFKNNGIQVYLLMNQDNWEQFLAKLLHLLVFSSHCTTLMVA